MSEITIDLMITCSQCGRALEFDQVDRNIYVEPCEKCIEDAWESDPAS